MNIRCRLMVLLMGVCFYVTGFLKNLLCLPRPPSPPVTPLQRCQDWSLPSHHAVLNAAIPWFIFFYLDLNHTHSLVVKATMFAAISLWSLSVMFSRMYLGVHSPADILTGGVIGCLLLAAWLHCHERVDLFLSSSPSLLSLLGIVCIVILLLTLHPDPLPSTIIFAETVSMTGVAMGFAVGQVLLTPPTGRGLLEEAGQYGGVLSAVGCAFARFFGGLVALVTTKILVEKITVATLRTAGQVAGVTMVCIKRKSEVCGERIHYSHRFIVLEPSGMESSHKQSWNGDNRPLNLDIPVKFISYTAMGVVGMAACPALFSFIGI